MPLNRARRAGGDLLARRLVEVGADEPPDRDLILDLWAVHGTASRADWAQFGGGERTGFHGDRFTSFQPSVQRNPIADSLNGC